MGNFWASATAFDPKRQYRFKVKIGGFQFEDRDNSDEYDDAQSDENFVWYAKSIEKPKMSFRVSNENEASVGSTYQDTKILSWPMIKPIKMVMVDPSYPNATRKLLRFVRRAGYLDNESADVNDGKAGMPNAVYFHSEVYRDSIGPISIEQIDEDGAILENWELIDPYIIDYDFGSLDYSSADLVEISITIGFKTFSVTQPTEDISLTGPIPGQPPENGSPERGFEYYKDSSGKRFNQDQTSHKLKTIYTDDEQK